MMDFCMGIGREDEKISIMYARLKSSATTCIETLPLLMFVRN